jgi:hypothetical protein
VPVPNATTAAPITSPQHLVPLRHSLYINLRAAFFGFAIGYGFWYLAHHASQFKTVVTILAVLIVVATLWTSHASMEKVYRLNYLILPSVLFVSSLFFFLLLKNPTYQLVFVAVIGAMYFYFFRAFAELREHPTPEKKKSVTQALDVVASITIFLSFASLQELYFFFNWKVFALVLTAGLATAILLYQIYWYHRVMTLRSWHFIALGVLLMAQLVGVLTFLPTGYLTTALVCVAGFYVYQALTVAALRGILKKRAVLEHIIVACVISAIAFISSRWTPLS